jgi:hypothetical protein
MLHHHDVVVRPRFRSQIAALIRRNASYVWQLEGFLDVADQPEDKWQYEGFNLSIRLVTIEKAILRDSFMISC